MLYVKIAIVVAGATTFVFSPEFASARFRRMVERQRRDKIEGRVPMTGIEICQRADKSYWRWVAVAFVTAMIGIVL